MIKPTTTNLSFLGIPTSYQRKTPRDEEFMFVRDWKAIVEAIGTIFKASRNVGSLDPHPNYRPNANRVFQNKQLAYY